MTKNFPFEFIYEELYDLDPYVKRMFGTHTIYIGDKVYLAARKSEKNIEDNGIWIATKFEYHDSIFEQFPSISYLNNIKMKKWLLLPETADDFEETALELCRMIKDADPRIGVIPK